MVLTGAHRMYLEDWMLFVLFILWLYSMFDLWKTGMCRGIDITLQLLEDNEMLLVDYDDDGNRIIRKIKRVDVTIDKDE
jgi:hypothetical protein